MNLVEQLLAAVKDEDEASLLYTKLADEVERKGLHRSARHLTSLAIEEKRHKETLEGIIEEVKVIGALVGEAAPGGRVYWWVRLGQIAKYERFGSREEAIAHVERSTGKPFSEAHWITPYGFELGAYMGVNYITLFEGDEATRPTSHHLYGKASSGGKHYVNEGNPVYR